MRTEYLDPRLVDHAVAQDGHGTLCNLLHPREYVVQRSTPSSAHNRFYSTHTSRAKEKEEEY